VRFRRQSDLLHYLTIGAVWDIIYKL